MVMMGFPLKNTNKLTHQLRNQVIWMSGSKVMAKTRFRFFQKINKFLKYQVTKTMFVQVKSILATPLGWPSRAFVIH